MTKFEMYRTLGLPFDASMEEIKEAYRRLVKKYHPDSAAGAGSGLRLNKVIQAYKNLTVVKRTGSIVDFPVKNVKKPAKKAPEPQNVDIFNLGGLLENGKTVGMRVFAARSLGNSGKKTAYAFLRKALEDPSEVVVKTAVEAIGNLRIKQSYGELSSLYSRGSRTVREAILETVQRIGTEGGFMGIVRQAAMDSDQQIRLNAKKVLQSSEKAMHHG